MMLHYPVTRKVLAKVYKIRPVTFTGWLRDLGIDHRKTLSPMELRIIIDNKGLPEGVEIRI